MAATTKKASVTATKKAKAKTTGEDVIDMDSPPNKKKKQHVADRAASYFLTTTLKGNTINPYTKGSKNRIDVVFHKGGVPSDSGKPMMLLDLGGKALRVKWKASERLNLDEHATTQDIPMDFARYMGYMDTMDCMHQVGVTTIDGYH